MSEEQFGPIYPKLGNGVAKFRRRKLSAASKKEYGAAVLNAVRALQASELARIKPGRNVHCASGTNYTTGEEILAAIRRQHVHLCNPDVLRRARSDADVEAAYKQAMLEKLVTRPGRPISTPPQPRHAENRKETNEMTESEALKKLADKLDAPQSSVLKGAKEQIGRAEVSPAKAEQHQALEVIAKHFPPKKFDGNGKKVKTVKTKAGEMPDMPKFLRRNRTPETDAKVAKLIKQDKARRTGADIKNPPNGERSKAQQAEYEKKAKDLGIETPKAKARKRLDKMLQAKGKTPKAGKPKGERKAKGPSEKVAEALKLAGRPNGASRAELDTAMGWKPGSAPWKWLFSNPKKNGYCDRWGYRLEVLEGKSGEARYKVSKTA